MYVLEIVVCLFVLFLLVIVLSVLLRYTDSDCPFGIFKLLKIKIYYQNETKTLTLLKCPPGLLCLLLDDSVLYEKTMTKKTIPKCNQKS